MALTCLSSSPDDSLTLTSSVMKTTILLVRHGQTDWNLTRRAQGHIDIPLNATGRQQSQLLARRLASWRIQAIYSSDLARASETAAILGQEIGLKPILDAAFRERNGGIFQGHTGEELKRLHPESLQAFLEHGRPPSGAESNLDLARRAVPRLEEIAEAHRGQEIALVSHGGTLRVIIAYLLGLPVGRKAPFRVSGNTGLTIAEMSDGECVITLLNDICHLEPLDSPLKSDSEPVVEGTGGGYTIG